MSQQAYAQMVIAQLSRRLSSLLNEQESTLGDWKAEYSRLGSMVGTLVNFYPRYKLIGNLPDKDLTFEEAGILSEEPGISILLKSRAQEQLISLVRNCELLAQRLEDLATQSRDISDRASKLLENVPTEELIINELSSSHIFPDSRAEMKAMGLIDGVTSPYPNQSRSSSAQSSSSSSSSSLSSLLPSSTTTSSLSSSSTSESLSPLSTSTAYPPPIETHAAIEQAAQVVTTESSRVTVVVNTLVHALTSSLLSAVIPTHDDANDDKSLIRQGNIQGGNDGEGTAGDGDNEGGEGEEGKEGEGEGGEGEGGSRRRLESVIQRLRREEGRVSNIMNWNDVMKAIQRCKATVIKLPTT